MQLDMKTDVVVHGTRVFLEKKADETTTAGGIILSEVSAKTFALYTVVASGVDKHSRGDQVVCQSMGPQALPEELFGERMFYVEAEDIVATIKPGLKELCEEPEGARENALRAYLEGLTTEDRAALISGAGDARSAAMTILIDHGYDKDGAAMVDGVMDILTVDPKVVVCTPDPACQSITDQQEGGTELKCPEKGGA